MYIPRPYESKVVGRQLAHSPGNGLFSWNLLRTPWQLTDRRGSQDVLCWEECVAQAHSPLQHHRHSDDCSVLNRLNQVCWTAVEACGRLQTVIPSSAYSMANFCVKFRVLITTHSFSSEHRLSHAHLCCLSSWTKKGKLKFLPWAFIEQVWLKRCCLWKISFYSFSELQNILSLLSLQHPPIFRMSWFNCISILWWQILCWVHDILAVLTYPVTFVPAIQDSALLFLPGPKVLAVCALLLPLDKAMILPNNCPLTMWAPSPDAGNQLPHWLLSQQHLFGDFIPTSSLPLIIFV